jgi:Tat protein translocase TatB subunit
MFNIGFPELLVIVVVALLVVGPQKLPDLAKSLAKGFAEFRKATEDVTETVKESLKADDLKAEMDDFKNSLLYGKKENDAEKKDPSSAPAEAEAEKKES